MEYWNKFTLYYHNYNDSKEWHVGEKLNQLQQCWTFALELVSFSRQQAAGSRQQAAGSRQQAAVATRH
jgi:hypothetical protein